MLDFYSTEIKLVKNQKAEKKFNENYQVNYYSHCTNSDDGI
jgi:hypothetical protein